MEGTEYTSQENPTLLYLDENAKRSLAETAKWSNFFAILGFICIGLILLLAISLLFLDTGRSAIFSEINVMRGIFSSFMFILYLAIGALYLYPAWKLYQFGQFTKQAMASNNSTLLAQAFEAQKSLYKFFGIITVGILTIYVLVFVNLVISFIGLMF